MPVTTTPADVRRSKVMPAKKLVPVAAIDGIEEPCMPPAGLIERSVAVLDRIRKGKLAESVPSSNRRRTWYSPAGQLAAGNDIVPFTSVVGVTVSRKVD